jgi:hypothetical protein
MFRESLVSCSMHLGVPFIAQRQLGAVGDQFGRPFLHSVEWCTGQSGAPPNSHCSCLVRDLLPYLAHPTVGPWGWLAHRTLSGARRTVRCAQLTVAAGHVSPADCAADRWLTGMSGAPPDSPMNYSRSLCIFPRAVGSPSASLAHRTLSGAPPDSPVCLARVGVGCTHPTLFLFFSSSSSSSFVTVSST